jgi:hypothetical protein
VKYRKKPVVIEAWPVSELLHAMEHDWTELPPVVADAYETGVLVAPTRHDVTIKTLEGDHRADRGDWLIRGVKGEMYPVKPDIFAATYEPVDGES